MIGRFTIALGATLLFLGLTFGPVWLVIAEQARQ